MTSFDWSDASTEVSGSEGSGADAGDGYRLTVIDGPEAGAEVSIAPALGSRILVGKSPACDLRLGSPDVSRRHAVFEIAARGLRVTDLGSTNGTTVNGVPVGVAFLRDGDRVSIAKTTLTVVRVASARVELPAQRRFGRMLGGSDAMRRLYPLCARLASTDLPALIEGETGTGKEVLAEALHEASPRAGQPFVVFDCTAFPPSLAESVLFGHVRGAFTGAVGDRTGVFEAAHGGTLFIDEIGDLDLALQPKLLRALERKEVQRVGSNQWRKVDVRIIAATRRDLDKEVQAARFRDDLFFRLAVGRIELPPLRDRAGDVRLLAESFWQSLGGVGPLSAEALRRFEDYPWPGNVRELQNAVARWIALGEVTLENRSPTPAVERAGTRPDRALVDEQLLDLPFSRARERVIAEFEREYVEKTLERHGGNVVRAAAASGIARRYFQILRARHRDG